jgi:small subunit ribosomal protein S8
MDKIANFIVALKNASVVGKEKIFFPYSKLIENIASLLKEEGYVKAVKLIDSEKGNPAGKFLEVVLNYDEAGKPKIREVARVSKGSLRVYAGAKKLPVFKKGHGLVVMTTPKGIMTAKKAKAEHVGGEVLFKLF